MLSSRLARLVRSQIAIAVAVASSSDKDRKSTRLNSSHSQISYAVFCLKKKMTGRNPGFRTLYFGPHHTPAHPSRSMRRRTDPHFLPSVHNTLALHSLAEWLRSKLLSSV